MSKMIDIQAELKAPKGQYNKFGRYNYRSCEDIVEAAKPLLKKHKCWLNLSDEILSVGAYVYVKSTATVYDEDGRVIASASAAARDPIEKKGSDASQNTGAASSYARKYALNGLFAIDDTKDADTMDNRIDNTVEIREDYVNRAEAVYREELEKEIHAEEGDFKRMQQVEHYLTNDERIAVMNKFGSETVPGGRKMLKNLVKELLRKTEADNG
jgi:hypothetical protein